jgi:hypothetical protein
MEYRRSHFLKEFKLESRGKSLVDCYYSEHCLITKEEEMKTCLAVLLLISGSFTYAQNSRQIRGTVTDHVLQQPLSGATVSIASTNLTVTTDEQGGFRFLNMNLGTYRIMVSYAGYKEVILDNVVINAGKETVIQISMENTVKPSPEITLHSTTRKNKPLNEMSLVSARAFTVEETQKYAASVNDPLRMATAFPGVLAGDDGNNSIIIRGNSPSGLLWRMEGMDIPNPNHFSNAGGSGGGISILSSQLLSNSDFITGAFAAEYGNALSGVFDLHLRKGNNEKKEYTLQAGVLGLNVAMEGPFSKKHKSSYLINYRYSTLELLSKIGVLPNDASTNFQDLSYNIYLPTKKWGTFSIFGFGGLSREVARADTDSSKWESHTDRYHSKFIANTGMTAMTHSIRVNNQINLKTVLGVSYTRNAFDEKYVRDDYSSVDNYYDSYNTRKWTLNSIVNFKLNRQFNFRAGIIANLIHFNYNQRSKENIADPLQTMVDAKGNTSTQQLFAQGQYKLSDDLTFNAGLHALRLALNNKTSLEPRLSFRWNISQKSSLALAFGKHSQLQGLGVYFAQQQKANGIIFPNKDLDLTKSLHYVLSYVQKISKTLIIKTEVYYQHLFHVPVDSGSFSILNIQDDFILDPLTNSGKGRNYGLEISIERYLKNNFYLTWSNSIYQSKYTGGDGQERNTRFNGNYISTFITGKDFVSFLQTKTFGINLKVIYAGGQRTTPIDYERSASEGSTVYKDNEAFSLQNAAYFRSDLRVSIKWNRKNITSTLSLDIQNLTNRQNVYNQLYDAREAAIVTHYQTGILPVLNYKVEF